MSVMMRNGLQYSGVPNERLDNLEEIVGDGQQTVGSDLTDAVTQLNSSLTNMHIDYLGKATNLNNITRTAGRTSISYFAGDATNNPNSGVGGYCLTFANSDTNAFGNQVIVTNDGIWSRNIQGNIFKTWLPLTKYVEVPITVNSASGISANNVHCYVCGRVAIFCATLKYTVASTDATLAWVSNQANSPYKPIAKTWLSCDYYGDKNAEAWIDTSGNIHVAQYESNKDLKISGTWIIAG